MSKISFILHGKHRNNATLVTGIRKAFGNTYQIVFFYTEYSGHAIELAKQAALQDSDYIISTGGDGTLNEVANGIMLSGNKEVKVGLLPYGTGNDFAKTIGVSNKTEELKQLIVSGSIKEIDLGLVQFKNKEGKEDSFTNIVCWKINEVGTNIITNEAESDSLPF
jgi:diacylglycerol kinase family enzyme